MVATAAASAADAPAKDKKVVILGGGIIGCSAAYYLALRGGA
jgi:glycine/D-amino acid oxidase-like deaminating enzyme